MTNQPDLIHTLEIPEYTKRSLAAYRVKSKHPSAISGEEGWISSASQEVLDLLEVGDPYILETRGTTVTGYIIKGRWYDRKSDQEINRQLMEWKKSSKERHAKMVEENREDWTRREANLPDWLKKEMEEAREDPDFEMGFMGWGYILVICELAAMYAKMGEDILERDVFTVDDTEEISQFARDNGTSGNQHGVALALAKRYIREGK